MRLQKPSRLSLIALSFVLAAAVGLRADPPNRDDNLRVWVVAITASNRHTDVDDKLKDIVRVVQKHDASLTGYRVASIHTRDLAVGRPESIKLFERQDEPSADVTVLQREDDKQRVRLAVKAPQVGEITYSTCYGKFFPILTRYFTPKDRELLIVAVMVKAIEKETKAGK